MTGIDLSKLKAQQDEYDARKQELMSVFVRFRESLLEDLEDFTQQALGVGLRGVEPFRRMDVGQGTLHAAFALNEFDLILVSTNEVYPLGTEDRSLAVKLFIYLAGSQENLPFVETAVWESGEHAYRHHTLWYTTKGPRSLAMGATVDEAEGHKTATALLIHFYGFASSWIERPSLRMMLSFWEGGQRPIGFSSITDD